MDVDAPATQIRWYRTPLDKEKLRGLTRRSDWLGLLQVVPHLLLVACSGAAAFYAAAHLPLWTLIPILFVHGSLFAFLANGFHELTHGTVFKTKALNAVFLRVFSFLCWSSHVGYKASHTRHHLYTLHPPWDREVVLPMRLTLAGFLGSAVIDPVGFWQAVSGTVRTAMGRLNGEWEHALFPEADTAQRRRLYRWARITLLGHAAIIAISAITGFWLIAVLTTGAIFYGRWVFFLNTYSQHTGLRDNVADFRLCTRTIVHNPVLQYLYFHMSFHAEHHMYASVPCYHLGRLRREIGYDMPAAKGMIGAWREIAGILKRQKADPSYQHTYELPRGGAGSQTDGHLT
jgi:fatty acid desaturase